MEATCNCTLKSLIDDDEQAFLKRTDNKFFAKMDFEQFALRFAGKILFVVKRLFFTHFL
jgi:hypothetical protein